MPKGFRGQPAKDEMGKRYGKLIIIERIPHPSKQAYWKCVCDCGGYTVVKGGTLRAKNGTKSCGCLKRLEKGQAAFNQMYGNMKRQAIKRGYAWNLTKEQVKKITKKDCHYCGEHPKQVAGVSKSVIGKYNGSYIYNGIDRTDNTVGYSIENVVPCCGRCNTAKNDMTVEEFKSMIRSIISHWLSSSDL